MTVHRLAAGPLNRHGARPLYRDGRLILVTCNPLRDAAAWLLEAGIAGPDDAVEVWLVQPRLQSRGL